MGSYQREGVVASVDNPRARHAGDTRECAKIRGLPKLRPLRKGRGLQTPGLAAYLVASRMPETSPDPAAAQGVHPFPSHAPEPPDARSPRS
jgi:hypothetical protein